jgi:hypothetical protein
LPDSDVSGTETGRGPATATRRQLGVTGDATRRLIILGGVAMLIGAVVIAFTGREEPAPLPTSESGVPLNPGKRELARRRAGVSTVGVSAESWFGGEPEA